ncbi:hypothetical protein AAFF27_03875 [Xylophilus sp. GW821-FHT01B05]
MRSRELLDARTVLAAHLAGMGATALVVLGLAVAAAVLLRGLVAV